MSRPATLARDISPPPTTRKGSRQRLEAITVERTTIHDEIAERLHNKSNVDPSLASIEAGKIGIQNHLQYFSHKLESVCRRTTTPRLSIHEYRLLYTRNQHKNGRYFVVHQHDHPISGVHYDLRLQFSDSSTISFAIPYGLPGNPNSIRPNRMAVETRVHCAWNNLIEWASHATGSLLIWDTGEYEIMPWKTETKPMTDEECSDGAEHIEINGCSHSEKLFSAFRQRHIRLRLHGLKLPRNYTIGLRLPTKNNRNTQPGKPRKKRRRLDPSSIRSRSGTNSIDTDTDGETATRVSDTKTDDSAVHDAAGDASDDDEDDTIRHDNAYPGATNSIGSVHQRNWFLSLDRRRSGFTKATKGADEGSWVGSWEPFFVYGRDYERSVVTGRTADEVMQDEGVEKFVGRKMWRPILE